MPKQIMLSDKAYNILAKRKGERSFSKLIIELVEKKNKERKDQKKFLKMDGIIKTKKRVSWSTEVDKILYGGKL